MRDTTLTAGNATSIAAALDCLKSGRYREGEDAVLAEKDWRPRSESEERSPSKPWSIG